MHKNLPKNLWINWNYFFLEKWALLKISLKASIEIGILELHKTDILPQCVSFAAEKSICGWEWDIPSNFHTTCFLNFCFDDEGY